MMNYEDALKEWGARKLESAFKGRTFDRSSVTVDIEIDPGYACCGGRDPDCYCSFAESPSAYVEICGRNSKGQLQITTIDRWAFDFATVVKEIVEAGGESAR